MIGERIFVLRDDAIRTRCVEFLGELPLRDPPLEVIVRTHKSIRSLEQNAFYWARLQEIGSQLGYGADEMHEVFKGLFLPMQTVDLGTEKRSVTGSTRKLKVAAFAEYVEKVEAWAVSNGIRLSETA